MNTLTPWLSDDRPERVASLFTERTRTVLKKLSNGWPGPDDICLPVPRTTHAEMRRLGAVIHDGKVSVARRDVVAVKFSAHAPLAASREFVPIRVEMIPSSAFGASLYNLLTKDCWKAFRKTSLLRAGLACEVCGYGGEPVEAHEVWTYHSGDRKGWGVQRLRALLCLCHDCHEMFHPGLANVKGRSKVVRERLCAVNCWTDMEWSEFSVECDRDFARRSTKSWQMDLSQFAEFGELRIDSRWSCQGETLTTKMPTGTSHAMIAGIPWSMVGEASAR
jgi:hypothetical protein